MPAVPYPQVRLVAERMSPHPWLYRRALLSETPLKPGSVVDLVDGHGAFLARGFWNGHARIGLRVLTRDPAEAIDADWIARRIVAAVALRRDRLRLDDAGDAWRVVHSEGDGLSGLVIDRYADLLVVEYFAAGMWRLRHAIDAALRALFPGCRLYAYAEAHVQKQESFDCATPPAPEPVIVREHGLRFHVTPGSRHKTGFFVDQRDNRQRFGGLVRGARVLDLCCNSGGFALAAAAGGAQAVTGVDLDPGILELARANAVLNGLDVRFEAADLFPWLEAARTRGERWDAVVLDPAKLTRDRERLPQALRTYHAMNRLALDVVAPGGLFLSCSCTGLVDEPTFLDTLRRAAFAAGRELTVLHVGGAGPDHPFQLHVPESRYLKAVLAVVR